MINVKPIILAGGKGTRMNEGRPSPVPKVLIPLGRKPMVSYILDTISNFPASRQGGQIQNQKSKIPNNLTIEQFNNLVINKPILVIGYKGELVKKEIGNKCDYVWQRQRLGTGHAARLAIEHLKREVNISYKKLKKVKKSYDNATNYNHLQPLLTNSNHILILQGDDSAFYKPKTLEKFINNHLKEEATLSFLTTNIPNVKDLGRVIRDKNGNVIGVVEKENLTKREEKITEINCGGYLINYNFASDNIKKIKKHLKKGREYPLPDIIKIALNQKKKVLAYKIPSFEWIGVNSPDQLIKAEKRKKFAK